VGTHNPKRRVGVTARSYSDPVEASARDHRRADEHPPSATLADLMEVSAFQLRCVAGHDQLGRTVRWAQSTELLDPSPYLRGGELVCTVGTGLTSHEACNRFVDSAITAQASAICFGTGDVHDEVPSQLVTACEAVELPLLVAPFGVPFIEIAEHLAMRGHADARTAERDSELIAELLIQVRRGATTEHLLTLATGAVGGRLRIVDGPADGIQVPSTESETDSAVTAPFPDGGTLAWSGPGTRPSIPLLRAIASVLSVASHERDLGDDLRRERAGQLLALVGDRQASASVLDEPLRTAGLSDSALVFSVWPAGASRLLAASLTTVPAVVGDTPSASIAVTASSGLVRETAQRLGIVCGYSASVPLSDSARGVGEARAAFELARRDGRHVGPEGLTTLEGLLEQQPPDRLRPFVDGLLSPLLTADGRRGTKYVETLAAYLDHDGSLTTTARAEYLHVNTVRHRLDRIRELTGRNPFRFEDRVALAIALWAHRRQQGARPTND
jgi:DNA-binding PucR family transcriptional regulator